MYFKKSLDELLKKFKLESSNSTLEELYVDFLQINQNIQLNTKSI